MEYRCPIFSGARLVIAPKSGQGKWVFDIIFYQKTKCIDKDDERWTSPS